MAGKSWVAFGPLGPTVKEDLPKMLCLQRGQVCCRKSQGSTQSRWNSCRHGSTRRHCKAGRAGSGAAKKVWTPRQRERRPTDWPPWDPAAHQRAGDPTVPSSDPFSIRQDFQRPCPSFPGWWWVRVSFNLPVWAPFGKQGKPDERSLGTQKA